MLAIRPRPWDRGGATSPLSVRVTRSSGVRLGAVVVVQRGAEDVVRSVVRVDVDGSTALRRTAPTPAGAERAGPGLGRGFVAAGFVEAPFLVSPLKSVASRSMSAVPRSSSIGSSITLRTSDWKLFAILRSSE